jgi:hypothetical protein
MRRIVVILVAPVVAIGLLTAGATGAARASRPRAAIVFNGQGNNLDAYESRPPFRHQRVITTRADDPKGLDINAQICFFPGRHRTSPRGAKATSARWFIAGEDTGQPNPPQGWGIFRLTGNKVGAFHARKIGKLTPTYQGSTDNAENYGCGFLRDGRVLTTDIGNQAEGTGDGQLIVWFPPFNRTKVRYCKIDVGLATAGGIAVDARDRVYVASARPPTVGVHRYTGPFPTSDTPSGGCDSHDATGAPMTTTVRNEIFIPAAPPLATPNAIVRAPRGGWYVSSVFNGVIAEYSGTGRYRRTILEPPAGEVLGAESFSTGTPLGIGANRNGDVFYADIGIVIGPDGIGPGDDNGTVRRIRIVDGAPRPPQTMARGLAFPDGIGVLEP